MAEVTRRLGTVLAGCVLVTVTAACSAVADYAAPNQAGSPAPALVPDEAVDALPLDEGSASGETVVGSPETTTPDGETSDGGAPGGEPAPSGASPDGDGSNAPSDDPAPPVPDPPQGAPVRTPVVINEFPHDASAFTQGLAYSDGVLVESLGIRGESGRRRVAPTTGDVSASVALSPSLFGSGLDVLNDTLVQLTLEDGVAIVADTATLLELSRITFEGSAWGLCAADDGRLVTSDGSSTLSFRDPGTLTVLSTVGVTLDGRPLDQLNELECVNGKVWANVWLTSDIVQIDPTSGNVLQRVDASALVPGGGGPDDVMNGIAFDDSTGYFYVTGKRWTVLYEVDLGPT